MHLIMQGKQSSAHSTPCCSICLCWWSIRCVKSSCGTGSFQHNCSVQSVFWKDFILLSPQLLIPAWHCNLSFLCGCYNSLKLHLTILLTLPVIPVEWATSGDPKTEITRRRVMDIDGSVLHFLIKRKLKAYVSVLYTFPMLLLSSHCEYSPVEKKTKPLKHEDADKSRVLFPVSLTAVTKPHQKKQSQYLYHG